MESHKPSTAGRPIRCKAAVCRVAGEPLVMEEIMVAPPRAYEARIRIVCTSLCQSDITFWKLKDFPGVTPRILGHEAIGVVESIGNEVIELKEGDTISPWMPRDGTSRFTDLHGQTIHHFLSVSSFTEYTVVDVTHLTKIDANVPMNMACLLSCGISTGVGAAWRTADVEKGSTVVIFGLGSIGLAVAEGARIRGAARIIGVDMKPEKFEIGKRFGITEFVNPSDCGDKSLSQQVMNEMTSGGADYCFECVGLPSLMEEAYACCHKGWGKTIVLGVARPLSEIKLQCFEVLHSGKILTGSLFGGLKPKSDITILLKHYMNKELELEKFVTHELDFKDINTAFDMLIQGESLRCVMWMDR
ncbi:Alcohol dehydrogenase-like 7 [Linum grandiflorum]